MKKFFLLATFVVVTLSLAHFAKAEDFGWVKATATIPATALKNTEGQVVCSRYKEYSRTTGIITNTSPLECTLNQYGKKEVVTRFDVFVPSPSSEMVSLASIKETVIIKIEFSDPDCVKYNNKALVTQLKIKGEVNEPITRMCFSKSTTQISFDVETAPTDDSVIQIDDKTVTWKEAQAPNNGLNWNITVGKEKKVQLYWNDTVNTMGTKFYIFDKNGKSILSF